VPSIREHTPIDGQYKKGNGKGTIPLPHESYEKPGPGSDRSNWSEKTAIVLEQEFAQVKAVVEAEKIAEAKSCDLIVVAGVQQITTMIYGEGLSAAKEAFGFDPIASAIIDALSTKVAVPRLNAMVKSLLQHKPVSLKAQMEVAGELEVNLKKNSVEQMRQSMQADIAKAERATKTLEKEFFRIDEIKRAEAEKKAEQMARIRSVEQKKAEIAVKKLEAERNRKIALEEKAIQERNRKIALEEKAIQEKNRKIALEEKAFQLKNRKILNENENLKIQIKNRINSLKYEVYSGDETMKLLRNNGYSSLSEEQLRQLMRMELGQSYYSDSDFDRKILSQQKEAYYNLLTSYENPLDVKSSNAFLKKNLESISKANSNLSLADIILNNNLYKNSSIGGLGPICPRCGLPVSFPVCLARR